MEIIDIPLESSGKSSYYTVKLHCGIQLNVGISKSSTVSELIKKVCHFMEFKHHHYFGLEYNYPKTKFTGWLDENKTLKDEVEKANKVMYLSFKYYDPEPETINCEAIRYYLYTQLRRDIVNGNIVEDVDILSRLAALSLQIEVGNYTSEAEFRRAASIFTFCPDNLDLLFESGNEFYDKIHEFYSEFQGFDKVRAEIEFLKICSTIPLYGLHRFLFLDSNKNTFEIGVGSYGICVFRDNNTIQNLVPWSIVKSIVIKDVDITIQIVGKNDIMTKLPPESVLNNFGLKNDRLLKIYEWYPNNNIIYKGHNYNYSKNFYHLIVQSFNFYHCKQSSTGKNSSTIVEKTLVQLKKEYGVLPHMSSTSIKSNYSKRGSTKHIKSIKMDNSNTNKSDSISRSSNFRRRTLILKSDMVESNDKASSSNKIKDMLLKPKSIMKKRTLRKSTGNNNEGATRTRSSTLSSGLATMNNDQLSIMTIKGNRSSVCFSGDITANSAENINQAGSLNPSIPCMKAFSHQDVPSSNTPNIAIGANQNKDINSSDSSDQDLVIESLNDKHYNGGINTHISEASTAFDASDVSYSNNGSRNVSFSNDENKNLMNTLNNWSNYERSSQILTNTDDILDFINNEQTIEDGALLGKLATTIKNKGPSSDYTFECTPHDNKMAENWIQSIGIKEPCLENDVINTEHNANNNKNFDKNLQIHDTDNNDVQQPNPILQANPIFHDEDPFTSDK